MWNKVKFVKVAAVGLLMAASALNAAALQEQTDDSSVPSDLRSMFGERMLGAWTLNGGVNVNYTYDDNAFQTAAGGVGDSMMSYSARFSPSIRRKKMSFQAHYSPSYSQYIEFDRVNSFSHQYMQVLTLQPSKRTTYAWTFSGQKLDSRSAFPFRIGSVGDEFIPIPDSAGPEAGQQIWSASTALKMSHRFSARNSLNTTISGGWTQTSPTLVGAGFRGSPTNIQAGFSTSWRHNFSARRGVGVTLSKDYFATVSPVSSHVHYQAATLDYSEKLSNRFSFQAGVGPSATIRQPGMGLHRLTKSVAANAGLSFKHQQTTAAVTAFRGSQLATQQSGIANYGVAGTLARTFGRQKPFTLSGGVSYTRVTDLVGTFANQGVGVHVESRYALTDRLQTTCRYQHMQRDGRAGSSYARNSGGCGVGYSFTMLR